MLRRSIAVTFLVIAVVLGVVFFQKIITPTGLEAYFQWDYYNQFGPLAICVELLIAGYYLLTSHSKANFTLALFGFTALLDPIFSTLELFSSQIPIYALVYNMCPGRTLDLFFQCIRTGPYLFRGGIWKLFIRDGY